MSFSLQGEGISRINGRETFSYILCIDYTEARDPYTDADQPWCYRHFINAFTVCLPSPKTTPRITRK